MTSSATTTTATTTETTTTKASSSKKREKRKSAVKARAEEENAILVDDDEPRDAEEVQDEEGLKTIFFHSKSLINLSRDTSLDPTFNEVKVFYIDMEQKER